MSFANNENLPFVFNHDLLQRLPVEAITRM
jgi:hypothetical protein